jgi:hypothetical protein
LDGAPANSSCLPCLQNQETWGTRLYPRGVNFPKKNVRYWAVAGVVATALVACHKQEQAVVGVAKSAVTAEQQARAAAEQRATKQDERRAELAKISLPTKSIYVDIHDPAAWANPFLAIGPDTMTLRIINADANTSDLGKGTMLRPEGARRQEIQIRPSELAEAMVAVPASAWKYGRVVAVAEMPGGAAKDRAKMRRNVENAIQQLNDLGIVVEEWPGR